MIQTAYAYAKINISLDIISKMEDGYHSIETVMQSVNLFDEITIECIQSTSSPNVSNIVVTNPGRSFLPCDERNIAAKAAKAFLEHNGITGYNMNITIKKNIPVSAGLGGGSADGACVFRMLDKMFETNLEQNALIELGSTVGSDIPFCLYGGTKFAQGRGEILSDLAPMPPCYIVICKPRFNFSTHELYKRVNCRKIRVRPDTEGIIASLADKDLNYIARHMYNVFEDFLPRGSTDIEDIKYRLLDNGALGAIMTGSGPTSFGIFEHESKANKAYDDLKQDYPATFLVSTVSQGFSYSKLK